MMESNDNMISTVEPDSMTDAGTTEMIQETLIDLEMLRDSVQLAVVRFLDLWVEGAIIVAGIAGNVIILLVIGRRKLKVSSSIFIRVLSVTDILLLSICLMTHWINYNFNPGGKAPRLCKTIQTLMTSLFDFEAWLIVCVTLDRFVSVVKPYLAKRFCTPRQACVSLAAILFLTVLKNWYIILLAGFDKNEILGTMVCTYLYDSDRIIDLIYPWLDLVWGSVLPMTLILILTTRILIVLWRTGKKVTGTGNDARRAMEKQVTVSMVCISLVFVALTLPRKLFLIIYTALPIPEGIARTHHAMNYLLLLSITSKLWYLNCAINVWLFTLSAKRFRLAVKSLFTCKKKIHPLESDSRGTTLTMSKSCAKQNASEEKCQNSVTAQSKF